MKLSQFAVAAFAVSMTAALAGDKSAMSDEKKAHGSMVSSEATGKVPAGYADKSNAAADSSKQKDMQPAQQMHGDAGLGASATAPNPGAPAGYADRSATASSGDMQQDTQGAQLRHDATVMPGEKNAHGSTVSSEATSKVPAGYADKSSTDKKDEQQDTLKAQSK